MSNLKTHTLPFGLSAAAGLFLAATLASPASAGLIGSYKIDGTTYSVGTGVTISDTDANYMSIMASGSTIKIDFMAPTNPIGDFVWNKSGGQNFTMHLTSLDWSGTGSYLTGATFSLSGTAALDNGYGVTLINGSSLDLKIDGDIHNWCPTANCGSMTITLAAYEPPPEPTTPAYNPPSDHPTAIPTPAGLALFGLGLAGLGITRRRKTA